MIRHGDKPGCDACYNDCGCGTVMIIVIAVIGVISIVELIIN